MKSCREDPKIVAAAERQMQAWALSQQMADRVVSQEACRRRAGQLCNYVAISRQAGAGGSEIARLVGQQLGWPVWDKNLLERIAERYRLDRAMLELVDETESSWLYDVLGTWMDCRIVSHDRYVSYLTRVILAVTRQHHCVLVGRGAQFLLPPDKGLAVRIIAPMEVRAQRVMQQMGLSASQARRYIEETDRGRREFVRRFFHRDIDDPNLYDLVINTARQGIDGAVRQILSAVCRPEMPAADPHAGKASEPAG